VLIFPELTAVEGDLLITGNATLSDIDTPLLVDLAGDIVVKRNPNLCEASVMYIIGRLHYFWWDGEYDISDLVPYVP